jgi:4-cresol dehydrogenase (hydroxylating)
MASTWVPQAAALEPALRDLAKALGEASVLADAETLAAYRDPFQPPAWDDYGASAVVTPRSVEEIQAVVAIANEHRVPLWTVGQGRNNG